MKTFFSKNKLIFYLYLNKEIILLKLNIIKSYYTNFYILNEVIEITTIFKKCFL